MRSCLLVIGSNTTEAHPVISYYMKRAVKKGATLIVCDPRKIDLTGGPRITCSIGWARTWPF